MGEKLTRDTGLNARDPSTVSAQIQWMKKWGQEHGGFSSDIWHGLRGHGGSIQHKFEPPHKSTPEVHIDHATYLDGEVIHRSVSKRMVQAALHPTRAPYFDGSRHWTPPDAGLATT